MDFIPHVSYNIALRKMLMCKRLQLLIDKLKKSKDESNFVASVEELNDDN